MRDIDSLWDFHDPAGSEIRFRDVLKEDPLNHEARTQLARSLGLQKKFDEARKELSVVAENLPEGPSRLGVRYLLELGRTHNSSGDKIGALELFLEAVEMSSVCGEAGLEIDALHMVAIADPENALDVNLKAIAKAEASSDPAARRWLASLYNNTGWSYMEQDNPLTALAYFEKAVPLRESMGDQTNIVMARWCVARTLRDLARQAEALSILKELLPEAADDAYVHQEIALCSDDLGHGEHAKESAAMAVGIFSRPEWDGAASPDILARLNSLASN